MPPLTATARASRREEILDAATRLFSERGFGPTGIDDIGEAVGITGPAVYRYFDSKDDLLVAVLERATQHAAAIVPRARAEARDDAEALTLAVRYVADACFDERALTLLYWQEARNLSAQQRQRFEAVQRESIDDFAGVLTAVRPELSASAARMAVHAAASLMRSIATRPSSLDIDTQRHLITTMAMAALMAAQP
ncbi:MAG: TetR family transcriptional regulator [Acidimicrobiia bacterium]